MCHLQAGKLAMQRGWSINIGGGFHHCHAKKGGGFCAYADITLCIKYLFERMSGTVKRAMIVDLDAHQVSGMLGITLLGPAWNVSCPQFHLRLIRLPVSSMQMMWFFFSMKQWNKFEPLTSNTNLIYHFCREMVTNETLWTMNGCIY